MKVVKRPLTDSEVRAAREVAKAFAILGRNRRFFPAEARQHLDAFFNVFKPARRPRRRRAEEVEVEDVK